MPGRRERRVTVDQVISQITLPYPEKYLLFQVSKNQHFMCLFSEAYKNQHIN